MIANSLTQSRFKLMEDHRHSFQALHPHKMGDNVCGEYFEVVDSREISYKQIYIQKQLKRKLMISKHRQICDVYVMNVQSLVLFHFYNYLHLYYLNNNFRH